MSNLWSNRYARRTKGVKRSAVRELLKFTQKPEVISFAGGLPAPELFPAERVREACDKILSINPVAALQYGTTEGYIPLRQWIADGFKRFGLKLSPDNVLITSGSQQALDLIAKLLINRGDVLLTEAPTYLGALQCFNVFGANYATVSIDNNGIRTDLMAETLKTANPKFMYLMSNFQNPGGVTMSLERRKEAIALSREYDVPILEDDPYGLLRFEGEEIPPMFALDQQSSRTGEDYEAGHVLYTSTFSKTLAPGLRIGWVVGPAHVIAKLVEIKQGTDLHTSTFAQIVSHEVASSDFFETHVQNIRRVYGERRAVMLKALEDFFPEGATWTNPCGGLFLWLTLPEGMDCERLFTEAIKNNVAFVTGNCFYPVEGAGKNNVRLNFSNSTPENIREGIRRLGEALKAEVTKSKATTVGV